MLNATDVSSKTNLIFSYCNYFEKFEKKIRSDDWLIDNLKKCKICKSGLGLPVRAVN